ncbi:type II toxin-antitoxin system HicB family antitoxin [Xanthobacter aminoxidans]|uniref:type II toxin-antitoxin system HicB family antitoxin n=1 Tax=Xanthobacter aminoxidans TaxID=186280 RepID=UPI002023089B|nr:type II toxin-antitoxin system HicB family antitoxin [Xanthobacter aminoxidans]MCL8385547.1 type II toxin-antitoxin system HicB family antitoxin [Xanthobacter aminoxidans]
MAYAVGIIHEENGTFGISFPDFPGAVSTGRSLEEAVAKGAEMLAFHVDGLAEDKALPAGLRTLDALRKEEPDWLKDGLAVLVPVELPGNVVRVNISVDERDLERIDRAAKAAGKNRSSYLVAGALRLAQEEAGAGVKAPAAEGKALKVRRVRMG